MFVRSRPAGARRAPPPQRRSGQARPVAQAQGTQTQSPRPRLRPTTAATSDQRMVPFTLSSHTSHSVQRELADQERCALVYWCSRSSDINPHALAARQHPLKLLQAFRLLDYSPRPAGRRLLLWLRAALGGYCPVPAHCAFLVMLAKGLARACERRRWRRECCGARQRRRSGTARSLRLKPPVLARACRGAAR